MINKVRKILLSILLLTLSFGLMYMPVKADSGWDSDYDSGGWDSDWGSDWDSDWGSDWDSDYGSSWSGSSGGGSYSGSSGGIGVIIIAVIIIIIVFSITNNKNNRNRPGGGNTNIRTKSNNYHDTSIQKISMVDPNLNPAEFKSQAFNIYKDIQTAWMEFDTGTIRKLTTDEIYNMYSSQLETLKLKGQKNIMKDITLEEAKIIDIKKTSNIITANVYLRVKCYDYVIKEKTRETVRGKDNQKIIIEYVLSFVKSAINNKEEEKCPNCGAPVDIKASATCPYCDSTLVKDASDYVMSKKTCIGQYLDR